MKRRTQLVTYIALSSVTGGSASLFFHHDHEIKDHDEALKTLDLGIVTSGMEANTRLVANADADADADVNADVETDVNSLRRRKLSEISTEMTASNMTASDANTTSTDTQFSLMDCESYDFFWILDLDHSCTYGENGCECEDAKQRVENNEIICEKGITECPDECPICNYCMESLDCL
jgi:hypothetical protein